MEENEYAHNENELFWFSCGRWTGHLDGRRNNRHFRRSYKNIMYAPIILNYSFCDEECAFFILHICSLFPLLYNKSETQPSIEIYLISRPKKEVISTNDSMIYCTWVRISYLFEQRIQIDILVQNMANLNESDGRLETTMIAFHLMNNMIMRSKFDWIFNRIISLFISTISLHIFVTVF